MKQFFFKAVALVTFLFVAVTSAAEDPKVQEVPTSSVEPQFTFYDANIEGLSAHRSNCSITFDKLMVITCQGGWSWLLTTRSFIGNANSKTSSVKADEAKQYQDLNLGARTSGNVITFIEGK